MSDKPVKVIANHALIQAMDIAAQEMLDLPDLALDTKIDIFAMGCIIAELYSG